MLKRPTEFFSWFRRAPEAIPAQLASVDSLLRRQLQTHAETPSLLFFTAHKCASSYISHVLTRIGESHRIVPVDWEGYSYRFTDGPIRRQVSPRLWRQYQGERLAESELPEREIRQLVPARGCYFGPIRIRSFFRHLPHFDQFKALLVLRDPRDVLTSLFFSVAYSHRAPTSTPKAQKEFLRRRQEIRAAGIDTYVLDAAPTYVNTYTNYCAELLGRPNVLLLRYEDMIQDFRAWLERVLEFWGLPNETPIVHRLIEEADFDVSEEDPNAHKRQVQPGDHQRKLQAQTIETLNDQFRDCLETLGYTSAGARGREAA